MLPMEKNLQLLQEWGQVQISFLMMNVAMISRWRDFKDGGLNKSQNYGIRGFAV